MNAVTVRPRSKMDHVEFPTGDCSGSVPSTFKKPDSLPSPDDAKDSKFDNPETSAPTSGSSHSDEVMKTDMGKTETSPHLDKIVQKDGPGNFGGDTMSLECPERKMTRVDSVDAAMTEINRTVKMECMQWTHVFMESEQFEMLSSNEVDKLLEDAKALEEDLIEQKERLLSHLRLLSQTLKLP